MNAALEVVFGIVNEDNFAAPILSGTLSQPCNDGEIISKSYNVYMPYVSVPMFSKFKEINSYCNTKFKHLCLPGKAVRVIVPYSIFMGVVVTYAKDYEIFPIEFVEMLNMFEETSTKNIVIGIILPDGLKI